MRWQGARRSENVEDERGAPTPSRGPALAIGGGTGGVALLIIIVLISWALGINPFQGGAPGPGLDQGPAPVDEAAQNELKEFVSVVLADTEDVWHEQFRKMGKVYREPKLRLFSGQTESACGFASAAVGPFYCPGDERMYVDLSFFDELKSRFQAPGDFAIAYVIAHEVGHHVQNQLGTMERVHRMKDRVTETEYNKLSVRLELQADFLAGVWAHHAQKMRNILEPGDLEEAIKAAEAVGDDRLQRQARGYVVPDSFTHGRSEQRVKWFKRGFQTGDISKGDTFSTNDL